MGRDNIGGGHGRDFVEGDLCQRESKEDFVAGDSLDIKGGWWYPSNDFVARNFVFYTWREGGPAARKPRTARWRINLSLPGK